MDAVAAMAAQVRAGCDLDALMALARSAGAAGAAGMRRGLAPGTRRPCPTRGCARTPLRPEGLVRAPGGGPDGRWSPWPAGAAFTFAYAEHAELLTAAGAEVVAFDPLRDEQAARRARRGLVIGGGFPEVYAAGAVRQRAAAQGGRRARPRGAPVAAECAGLLYLARELDGQPMCGVLDAAARMSERLTLGYREAVAVCDSSLAVAGTRMRGHEFHRTVRGARGGADARVGAARGRSGGSRASCSEGCTRAICTRTGRPRRCRPRGSWRGAARTSIAR